MRFRPANISLINRRHYLPRLLLTLSSERQIQKPHQRFEDVDRVTPYQVRVARHSGVIDNRPDLMSGHISGSSTRTGDAVRALQQPRKRILLDLQNSHGARTNLIAKETSSADRLSRRTGGKKGVLLTCCRRRAVGDS